MLNSLDMALIESLDHDMSLDLIEETQDDELLEGVIENDPHEIIDTLVPEVERSEDSMLEARLSYDTEYDVFEETDEFVVEQELKLEEEAEEELIFGECDDMDMLSDDDAVGADSDQYYDEVDDDDDII